MLGDRTCCVWSDAAGAYGLCLVGSSSCACRRSGNTRLVIVMIGDLNGRRLAESGEDFMHSNNAIALLSGGIVSMRPGSCTFILDQSFFPDSQYHSLQTLIIAIARSQRNWNESLCVVRISRSRSEVETVDTPWRLPLLQCQITFAYLISPVLVLVDNNNNVNAVESAEEFPLSEHSDHPIRI